MQRASSTVFDNVSMASLRTGAKGALCDQKTMHDMEGVKKVLVVGPKGSGKSTIIKRLQILVEGQAQSVLAQYKPQIIANVVEVAIAVTNYLGGLQPPSGGTLCWLHQLRRALGRLGLNQQAVSHISTDFAEVLYHAVLDTYAHEALHAEEIDDIQFPDSAVYLIENINRIGRPAYEPTVADVLRAWTEVGNNATHPIQQTLLGDLGVLLLETRIIDPPALAIDHLLQNVDPEAVIFVVPLAAYEDQDLFDELVRFYKLLDDNLSAQTPIILVFNQVDIFTRQLAQMPLSALYTVPGGHDLINPLDTARSMAEIFIDGSRGRPHVFFADATSFMQDREILEVIVG